MAEYNTPQDCPTLSLREYTLEDAPILYQELGCNPAMLRYTGWNPYSSLESTREFLSHAMESKEDYSWIIEVDGQVVGTIGAYDYCAQDGSIEVGYSIFQKYWGRGYASGPSISTRCCSSTRMRTIP